MSLLIAFLFQRKESKMLVIVAVAKLGELIRKFLDNKDKNKSINELYALSDHELRDIGLTRGEISSLH
jgi:uncharacterized protein YjiS (DUF1127 family)